MTLLVVKAPGRKEAQRDLSTAVNCGSAKKQSHQKKDEASANINLTKTTGGLELRQEIYSSDNGTGDELGKNAIKQARFSRLRSGSSLPK